MPTSLKDDVLSDVMQRLEEANQALNAAYPGDHHLRQPVHTVYGGAHLFKADTPVKLGQMALRALSEYAPDFVSFAQALALPGYQKLPKTVEDMQAVGEHLKSNPDEIRRLRPESWLAATVYQRVTEKLKREALEDFRIDFEDGFGNRPDPEEDEAAEHAARELAKGMADGTISPYIGIRIKPFTEELKRRGIRTLDIFVSTLVQATGGKLPDNFVVTLPKVMIPEQVAALADLFEHLETKLGLPPGSLKMEIMVETTQSIINPQGACTLPSLVAASGGRCTGAHFGTYDYTASCSITAAYQSMDHPACDFARHMMKVSLNGTGVWLSDGATNVMPVGPHRGEGLTQAQLDENRRVVHAAWKLGYDHIMHSLRHGFYQGWDLHPAQFPVRYAACYTFFLESFSEASERLANFVERSAQATLSAGNVFDDAATGQGLLNYFLRALNCGAVTESEITATGLTLEEVQCRSFAKILENRRQAILGSPIADNSRQTP